MRVQFTSKNHPLRIAKILKKHLSTAGKTVSLGEAYRITAVMYGYAHWHELEANARAGHEPTPWDDDVDLTERERRRHIFGGRLSQLAAIPIPNAERIIDEVRPLGRVSGSVGAMPEWKTRLVKRRNASGFLKYDPDAEHGEILARWKPGVRGTGDHTTIVEHGGETLEVYLHRGTDLSEYGCGKVHPVRALLVSNGRIVGSFAGSVFKCVGGVLDETDFFNVCDSVGDDEAMMAHLLNEWTDPLEVFEFGSSLLMVFELEVARGMVPPGAGQAFLTGIASILRKSDKGFSAVALRLDPMQFSDIPLNERLNRPAYREAALHLRQHIMTYAHDLGFGRNTTWYLLDPKPTSGLNPFFDVGMLVAKYNKPDVLDDLDREELQRLRRLVIKVGDGWGEAIKNESTRNDPSEPLPAGPFAPLPAGFDEQFALLYNSFDPHPEFWRHMPSDVVSVKVTYWKPGMQAVTKGVNNLVFRFRNGTELTMHRDYLPAGPMFPCLPPGLIASNGQPMYVNPFTDRYTCEMLAFTLMFNSLLLFMGSKPDRVNWPEEPVILVRPGRA